ncbi:hypothetical protein [uncultured Shewanella sp.]|uniref:hypothetical protein n=1 Tax=uncultured Shewanella sp. TaxID=173975 RepID=UPI0026379AB8|nr:hypothetical protein [uncultured Shewanella sp.]
MNHSAKNILNEWISRLNKDNNTQLEFEGDVCFIPFDETLMSLKVFSNSPDFYINTCVAPLPDSDYLKLKVMQECLKINQNQIETLGAALAIDDDLSVIMLSFLDDINAYNVDSFNKIIEAFYFTALRLRNRINFNDDKLDSNDNSIHLI